MGRKNNGALAVDPMAGIQFGNQTAQQKLNTKKNSGQAQRYWKEFSNANTSEARRAQIQNAWGFTGGPQVGQTGNNGGQQETGGPDFSDVMGQANQAASGLFGQIQQEGAFNPGSFQEQQNAAYNSVMDQFNRSNQPVFDKQQKDFQSRMMEQGIDPNSERYRYEYQQLQDSQNTARQNAESQAYQSGLGAQQQGWNQASAQYQMPYQNLGAFNGYMSAQANAELQNAQNAFTGAQNDAQRKAAWEQMVYQMAHQKGGGGGSTGLTFQQQMALQQAAQTGQLNNAVILQGMQNVNGANQNGSATNGAVQGFTAGVGNGITNALLR